MAAKKKAPARKSAAKKKRAASAKVAPKGKGKGKTQPSSQPAYLLEVSIIWCDKKGRVRQKSVDIQKATGLWWGNPKGTKKPNVAKVPGSKPKKLGKCDAPPPGGDTCCWFDGTQWRCPDDFA
jgi:hypothetical protein